MGASGPARAVHTCDQDGQHHEFHVTDLHVWIYPQDGLWNAQAVEIDYAACGSSLADVQRRFETGFLLTVCAHLAKFGTLDRLQRPLPEGHDCGRLEGSQAFSFELKGGVQLRERHPIHVPSVPYDHIQYVEPRLSA